MFRTSNTRGHDRFTFFQNFLGTRNSTSQLTQDQVRLIEQSDSITLGEKVDLFLIALGNKLTTELYLKVDYQWSGKEQKELPNQKKLSEIKQLLDQLPFQFFEDTLLKKNRQTGRSQQYAWFQVSVNEAVSHFMKKYPDDLTEFEEGILYGFPLSAIRAFSGLIEPIHDMPNAATHHLAGVMSKAFWQDEQDYYQLWWERLRKLSPKIIAEAEEKFNKEK